MDLKGIYTNILHQFHTINWVKEENRTVPHLHAHNGNKPVSVRIPRSITAELIHTHLLFFDKETSSVR